MPGLHGNEDKPFKTMSQTGRVINPSLPPNRPVPPGVPQDGASGISGGDPPQPRIPPSVLRVPGSDDPLPPPLQRSPLRTIIGPPNGPMAIGRPLRLQNNGASVNGVHDVNGNAAEPTTVVHTANGPPVPVRTTGPISSQQLANKNVQPGILASSQPSRVGIQSVSVSNSAETLPNGNDANKSGVSSTKKASNSNGQEKVFQKSPKAIKREEARKNTQASPTKKTGDANGDKNKKDEKDAKNGKNGNGKNGGPTNSPTKNPPKVNEGNKNEEKSSPQRKITPPKSQESPSPVRKKVTIAKPQESPSPTRKKVTIAKPQESPSPTRKNPQRDSPSPPRKKIKSPLPSPKVSRKNLLTTESSPTKLLAKPPNNATLTPGRPLPSTNVITNQPVAGNPDEVAKTAEGDKTNEILREKPSSEASAVYDRLLTLCKRGDWLAVETLLNHLDGLSIPPDLVDDVSTFSFKYYSLLRIIFVSYIEKKNL